MSVNLFRAALPLLDMLVNLNIQCFVLYMYSNTMHSCLHLFDCFLVEPACGEQAIVVTTSVWYMCMGCACVVRALCIRPDLSRP